MNYSADSSSKITMTWGCEYFDFVQYSLPPVRGGAPAFSTARHHVRAEAARVWTTSHGTQSAADNITLLITSNRIAQQQAFVPGKFAALGATFWSPVGPFDLPTYSMSIVTSRLSEASGEWEKAVRRFRTVDVSSLMLALIRSTRGC